MEEEEGVFDLKTARDVGQLSFRALTMARDMVKPGIKLLDVATVVEKFVMDSGYTLAFPINLSINEEAAHYSPSFMDEKTFGEGDVVKVDFGAAKDGVLGDCAVTVDLSGARPDLVAATSDALQNAISVVRAGVRVCDIGREIGRTIEVAGFKPVMNLGGHGVAVHELHSEVFIPNYDNNDDTVLKEGMVVAIEPFATDGKVGMIRESEICEIYSYLGEGRVRMPRSRAALQKISKDYNSEPFAARWIGEASDSKFTLYAAMKEIVESGSLERHPVLSGIGEGIISQAELEVLVQKDGCEVLTRK